jgi:hypothetical protein
MKIENEVILEFSIFRSGGGGGGGTGEVKIARFLYCFSVCSQKYRRMIKDFYFIFGLTPDLATSSSYG